MCSAARVPWEGEHSALLPKQREESSDCERIVESWSFWASFVPQVNYIFVLEYVALKNAPKLGITIKPSNRITVWPSDQWKRIRHTGSVSPSSKADCIAKHCNALQCTARHCNTLQCTAMHCNALQCTEMHCNALQCTAMHYNALQCTAMHCNALQCTAMHCIALQYTAIHCSAVQCNEVKCNAMQCTPMHCNTLQCTAQSF